MSEYRHKAFSISELYQLALEPNTIGFQVKIDLMSLETSELKPIAIMTGVADAVRAHVLEHHAEELYKAVQAHVVGELRERITKELMADVIKRIDLDAVAKLATFHAGKALGVEVAS